jgi:hypothetical protein
MNYLVANGLLVVLLTPANYVLGHWWTFATSGRSLRRSQLSEDRDLYCSARLGGPGFEGVVSGAVTTP